MNKQKTVKYSIKFKCFINFENLYVSNWKLLLINRMSFSKAKLKRFNEITGNGNNNNMIQFSIYKYEEYSGILK